MKGIQYQKYLATFTVFIIFLLKNSCNSEFYIKAKARDLAKDRGLTRAEVTFYCADNVHRDSLIEDTLKRITQYVSPPLVYSTPFAVTWRAYCDAIS